MIGLALRFDLGRYHANPWGAHVNEARIEWPPSPWRLLRALYSVSRTHLDLGDRREAIDKGLRALARAGPPVYELPPSEEAHTRHYLPHAAWSPSKSGETSLVIDAFRALAPDGEVVAWWRADLPVDAMDGLSAAARCLGYLGRSESVCSARLADSSGPASVDALPAGHVDPGSDVMLGRIELRCFKADLEDPIASLEASVTELRASRKLAPPGTELVDYAVGQPVVPLAADAPSFYEPTVARFRLVGGSRPGIREAVAVASGVRRALQNRYGAANDGRASPVFSGRAGEAPRRDQHRHAHYLSLPGAGGQRIDHVVVWAPEGFVAGEMEALAGLTHLRLRDMPEPLRLGLAALGGPDAGGTAGEQALRWRSLTPFALVRHPKQRRGKVVDGPVDQIVRELSHRGFPEPEEVELVRGSWLEFRRQRPGVSRLEASRVVGASLRFAAPVRGPMALGGLCHYGLGLFVPSP